MPDGTSVPIPEEGGGAPLNSLPWHAIPKFTPGVTNVQEYSQKLQFLASMWPKEHLPLLGPRVALSVEGTAFRKVSRLNPEKLKSPDTSGVALIVTTIGGSWGSTELEERYEYFERALYGTVQKQDESHDSFLSRMEANFVELISRGTTLEEVQAYVLLRQSTLGSEDKKRILLEHGGNLKYDPVVKSFRLLGSKFFHDFNTGRTSSKTKVYDINFTEKHDGDLQSGEAGVDKAYIAMFDDPDPELDPEFMEIMLSQEDSDALLVNSFEGEFEEFLQETPEMHEALISYIDARARLQEKKKSRGFWPISAGSSSKGRGRFSRDGKGKGKGNRRKEQLLARIARSHCRKCGALGHWKAECPQNSGTSKDPSSSASANVVSVDALTTCVAEGSEDDVVFVEEADAVPFDEFLKSNPQVGLSCCCCCCLCRSCDRFLTFPFHDQHVDDNDKRIPIAVAFVSQDHIWTSRNQLGLSQRMHRFVKEHVRPSIKHPCIGHDKSFHKGSLSRCDDERTPSRVFNFGRRKIHDDTEKTFQEALQVGENASTSAILDTGASRCIIGEKTLSRLRFELPEDLSEALHFRDSKVKFRFGNNQTLTSTYQILFPLKCPKGQRRRQLAVEVVPGLTPFLFSKKAFQSLGGVLDTRTDRCTLHEIETRVQLTTNKTGLYLMNIADICQGNQSFTSSITPTKEEIHSVIHNMFANGTLSEGDISLNVGESNVSSECTNLIKPVLKSPIFVASSDSKPIDSSCDRSCVDVRVNHAESDGHFDSNSGRIHCTSSHVASSTGDSLVGTGATGIGRNDATRDGQSTAEHDERNASPSSNARRIDFSARSWTCRSSSLPRCFGSRKHSASGKSSNGKSSSGYASAIWNATAFDSRTGIGDRMVRGRILHSGRDSFSDRSSGSGELSNEVSYYQATCEPNSKVPSWPGEPSFSGNDHSRVGQHAGDLGAQTSWEDLSSSDGRRLGLLSMEPTTFRFSTTRAPGLLSLLPSEARGRAMSCDQDIRECQRRFCRTSAAFKKMNKEQKKIQDQISMAISSADESMCLQARQCSSRFRNRPISILEVYAGRHSPITEIAQQSGFRVKRFTIEDGDLSTVAGRNSLWACIEEYQPEHIWVAPECGPWGGWNRLNQSKGITSFERVQRLQQEQIPHVELCARLCQYQHDLGRHFHLEQPLGSGMPNLPEFQPIKERTLKASFHMCRFGLKIPGTDKFIQKGSQVFSTSIRLHEKLDGKRCLNDHDHQRIEGSFHMRGQRHQVSKFCATYCKGFASLISRELCSQNHPLVTFQQVLVNEDEPPTKRVRFTNDPNKRRRNDSVEAPSTPRAVEAPNVPNPDAAPSIPNPEVTDREASEHNPGLPVVEPHISNGDQWKGVFQEVQARAPRVGNSKFDADSPIGSLVQELIPTMQLHCLFICRGTERYQVPLHAPSSHQYPLRHTVCVHRHTGEIHDLGQEDWHRLTRAQRIRASIPSKLTITMFGSSNSNVESGPERSHAPAVPAEALSEPVQGAVRVSRHSELPDAVRTAAIRGPSAPLEGWAPPPIPLHGPKFRNLTDREKQDLIKLHKNLGHPDPNVLAEHLKMQRAAEHIIDAAREFVCDACVESSQVRHQRPAKLHDPKEFNEMVGADCFYWTGKAGFQVMVFHTIDESSLFHLGRRLENCHLEHVLPAWSDMWFSWAGSPQKVYTDPAGEFRSDQWLNFLQANDIQADLSTESWQNGRAERHGQVIERMLDRYDQEETISNPQVFDAVLRSCFHAKNSLMRHQGYSPEQIVLGKASKIPGSLTSDERAVAHSHAMGQSTESERFREQLDMRARARRAFLITDNDQALRRALLRRSCPLRGPFFPGQLVLYWQKRHKPNRQEVGKWFGPAKVVCSEGHSVVWISHGDRLLRCAPECLRSASLREWNQQGAGNLRSSLHEEAEGERNVRQPQEPFIPETPNVGPSPAPTEHDSEHVTPTTSILQPESEMVPESPHISTPASVNPPDPHDIPFQDAIDLDPEEQEVLLSAETMIAEPEEEVQEWLTYQVGTEASDVCFAEDGLPYHPDALICEEHQCFVLEVDMNRNDIIKWSQESRPEEMIHVAAASKRGRSEVSIRDLTNSERALFDSAKDSELNCWMQTNALRPILRRHLNPEQILKSRWVLTWKSVESDDGLPAGRKAKARLVVLGYQDPRLTEVCRDAPTLTKEGRHTILQIIATHQWVLSSFDIKTAFLRGKADEENPLAMEPPIELRRKMQLSDEQVCALIGNAYGRVDAPLLFYKELTKQLKSLGFTTHPLEPCIHYLESWKDGKRILHGVLGTHVDDGVCGGDTWFHDRIEKLKKVLPFGSFKQRRFVFTGIQLEQYPDFSISASQKDFVSNIPAIDIGKHRRADPESAANDSEISKLRGLIGSLQYAVTHTRPDVASRLGEVQTQLSKPTIQTLLTANRVLREAQHHCDVKIWFRHIDKESVTHVAFGDASFASPKQLASFQGSIICATTPELQENKKAPISPLCWSSKKIARVVRSTLSAEAYSMSRSVDKLGWLRLLWGVLHVTDFCWRDPQKAFLQLPSATVVTDCKSLFDLVTRTAMPSCEEFRTTLEVLLIRERSTEHTIFRWIPTSLQLADALTKPMDSSLLRIALETGVFQLFDEAASLQTNAHKKQAVKWLRDRSHDIELDTEERMSHQL